MRLAANLTQRELAIRSGLSQSLISRIEQGTVDPRLSTLKKILATIDTSIPRPTKAGDIMHSPVISIDASQSVRSAVELMERHGISQLPVLRNGYPIGSVLESTVVNRLAHVRDVKGFFERNVQAIMEEPFTSIPPQMAVEDALLILSRGVPALLVMEKSEAVGIITKIDAILALLRSEGGSAGVKAGLGGV